MKPIVLLTFSLIIVGISAAETNKLDASLKTLDKSILELAADLLQDKGLSETDAVDLGDEIRSFQTSFVKEPQFAVPGRRAKYDFHLRASEPLLERNERRNRKVNAHAMKTMADGKMSSEFLEAQSMRQKLKDYLKKYEVESDVNIKDDDINLSSHPVDLSKYVLPSKDYASHLLRVDALDTSEARKYILSDVDKEDTIYVNDQFGNQVPVIPGIDVDATVPKNEELSSHPVTRNQLTKEEKSSYASHLLKVDEPSASSESEKVSSHPVTRDQLTKEEKSSYSSHLLKVDTPDRDSSDAEAAQSSQADPEPEDSSEAVLKEVSEKKSTDSSEAELKEVSEKKSTDSSEAELKEVSEKKSADSSEKDQKDDSEEEDKNITDATESSEKMKDSSKSDKTEDASEGQDSGSSLNNDSDDESSTDASPSPEQVKTSSKTKLTDDEKIKQLDEKIINLKGELEGSKASNAEASADASADSDDEPAAKELTTEESAEDEPDE